MRPRAWITMWGLIAAPAVAQVEIVGLDEALTAQVRGHLDIVDLDCDSPRWMVRWQQRNAPRQASDALEAVGYYDATIDAQLTFDDECWLSRLAVTPGPATVVAEVQLDVPPEAAARKRVAAATARLRALKGERLVHGEYESAKQRLLQAAVDTGHLEATYTVHRVEVDTDAHTARIHLALDTGPRYRFGEITIVNEVLQPTLMHAFLPFRSGDPYDAAQLTALRRALTDSDYFNDVIVTPQLSEARDGAVPIRIEVTPPSRNWAYNVGIGYATDTGPRLRAGAADRLRNRRGHRAEARALASEVLSGIDLSYSVPHRKPPDDWITFDSGYAHENSDTVNSDRQRYGVRHTYMWGRWIRTDYVDLTFEDYEIADQHDDSRLIVLGSTFDIGDRNDPVRPTKGYRFKTTIRGATQTLGSDTDFLQGQLFIGWVYGLTPKLRVLGRGTAGWTLMDDFDELPPSVRFFAGGDNSIRGYGYQKVGEKQDGEVVGGERLLTGSFELDFAFRERWSVAAFVDSGSAFDDEPDFSTGVGAGLRWYSPIGPIRFDLAHPLDDDERSVRVHLTLGPDI